MNGVKTGASRRFPSGFLSRLSSKGEPGQALARWIWLVGFAEGTVVHVHDLVVGGLHAYGGQPVVVQVWWQALFLLDPLVVSLVWRRRPAGVLLGVVVMLGDMAGFWWTQWDNLLRHPDEYLTPYGLSAITVFGLFVLISAAPLRRGFTRRED